MEIELLTNECGFEIYTHFLSSAGYLCEELENFENHDYRIRLLKLPNPNSYTISIFYLPTLEFCTISILHGTETEARAEFQRLIELPQYKK